MCEILPGQDLQYSGPQTHVHLTLSRGTEPCWGWGPEQWVSHIRIPRRALKNPDTWASPQDQLNQHL